MLCPRHGLDHTQENKHKAASYSEHSDEVRRKKHKGSHHQQPPSTQLLQLLISRIGSLSPPGGFDVAASIVVPPVSLSSRATPGPVRRLVVFVNRDLALVSALVSAFAVSGIFLAGLS